MTEPRSVVLTEPSQLKALGHAVRTRILTVLEDTSMSAKGLADHLGMTHGKVGHHLGVLARAGLVEVVEERQARGFTERLFRTTYDRLEIRVPGAEHNRLRFMFEQAAREAAPADEQPFDPLGRLYSIRIRTEDAERFARRLVALADEFAEAGDPQGDRFGFTGAVYRIADPGGRP